MKKHELLKYAYDNYPKGVKFKSIESGIEIISNGKFIINGYMRVLHIGENNVGLGVVSSIVDCELKWAEIIEQPKSILDGKVATDYKTEDGYDIYIGDVVSWAIKSFRDNKWYHSYDLKITPSHVMGEDHCLAERNVYRVFSTPEAAQNWINEQNKPKIIAVRCGVVSLEGVSFIDSYDEIAVQDVIDMYNAIKQLKGGDNA